MLPALDTASLSLQNRWLNAFDKGFLVNSKYLIGMSRNPSSVQANDEALALYITDQLSGDIVTHHVFENVFRVRDVLPELLEKLGGGFEFEGVGCSKKETGACDAGSCDSCGCLEGDYDC